MPWIAHWLRTGLTKSELKNVPKCEKHIVAIGQSINYVTINLGRKEFPSSCMLHKMMSDAIVQPEKQWS